MTVKEIHKIIMTVLTTNNAPQLMTYMSFVLLGGIAFAYILSLLPYVPRNFVRKSFHVLVVALFVPGIYFNMRLMVFAFNSVTCLMILLEIARYTYQFSFMNAFLHPFLDKREDTSRLIVTYVTLLLGCTIPPLTLFITVDGGFFNTVFAKYALSGVIVLGFGDTFASILGKAFGKATWGNYTKKTKEGSSYFVVFTAAAYYVILSQTYPNELSFFMEVFLGTIIAAVAEGMTVQYDNLVIPVLYLPLMLKLSWHF